MPQRQKAQLSKPTYDLRLEKMHVGRGWKLRKKPNRKCRCGSSSAGLRTITVEGLGPQNIAHHRAEGLPREDKTPSLISNHLLKSVFE